MALVEKYVDPTATGSPIDGSNWDQAYRSLSAWNTAEATDLVAAGNTHTVYCRGGVDTLASNTKIDIGSNWVTGASNYITIIGQGHTDGKLDTSKYYLNKESATTTDHMLTPDKYTRILDMQFRIRSDTGVNASRSVIQTLSGGVGDGVQIRRCIFDIGGTSATYGAYAIFINGAAAGAGNCFISDNIFICNTTAAPSTAIIDASFAGTADRVKIYNNTFINLAGGTRTAIDSSTFKIVNNIFQGWTTDAAGTYDTGTNYNLTDAASFPAGANNVTSTTLTFAGSGSYKLHSSDSAAKNAGVGPASDSQVQTTDFEGTARAGATADIGADQSLSTPSITSTSDDTPTNGSTLTLTGTNFEAAQGTGGVTAAGVGWTETSWDVSGTSIAVTVALGDNKYNENVSLVVTNNSGGVSSGYNVQIQPAAGVSYVNLSGTLASSGDRITAVSDLASGDQLEISNIVGGAIGDVMVNVDASFSVASGVTAFDVRANDGTGWGTVGTQYTTTGNTPYMYSVRKSKRIIS